MCPLSFIPPAPFHSPIHLIKHYDVQLQDHHVQLVDLYNYMILYTNLVSKRRQLWWHSKGWLILIDYSTPKTHLKARMVWGGLLWKRKPHLLSWVCIIPLWNFLTFFKDSSCVLLLLNKLFFKIGKDYSLCSGKTGARVAARSSVVSSNVSLRKKPKIVSINSWSSPGVGGGGEEPAIASHEEEEK